MKPLKQRESDGGQYGDEKEGGVPGHGSCESAKLGNLVGMAALVEDAGGA